MYSPYDCRDNETETLEIINPQDETGRKQFIPTEISRVARRCGASKAPSKRYGKVRLDTAGDNGRAASLEE